MSTERYKITRCSRIRCMYTQVKVRLLGRGRIQVGDVSECLCYCDVLVDGAAPPAR